MHSIDALLGGLYKFAGNMIAASILQGGPGFPVLSPALYQYLSTQSLNGVFNLASAEDIPDSTIANAVAQVRIYQYIHTYVRRYLCTYIHT